LYWFNKAKESKPVPQNNNEKKKKKKQKRESDKEIRLMYICANMSGYNTVRGKQARLKFNWH
jgi:hypothetical protein